jgi:hypothetical protein
VAAGGADDESTIASGEVAAAEVEDLLDLVAGEGGEDELLEDVEEGRAGGEGLGVVVQLVDPASRGEGEEDPLGGEAREPAHGAEQRTELTQAAVEQSVEIVDLDEQADPALVEGVAEGREGEAGVAATRGVVEQAADLRIRGGGAAMERGEGFAPKGVGGELIVRGLGDPDEGVDGRDNDRVADPIDPAADEAQQLALARALVADEHKRRAAVDERLKLAPNLLRAAPAASSAGKWVGLGGHDRRGRGRVVRLLYLEPG